MAFWMSKVKKNILPQKLFLSYSVFILNVCNYKLGLNTSSFAFLTDQ